MCVSRSGIQVDDRAESGMLGLSLFISTYRRNIVMDRTLTSGHMSGRSD